jgi:hypothetical protein
MRRIGNFLVVLLLMLLALPVLAQEEEGTIARIIFFRAKPGMQQQLEEGLKKHMAWHKAQNDPWAWGVWSYLSGEETGMYGGGTFEHKWEDFDNPPVDEAADRADAAENVIPYTAPGTQVRFYESLPKVSKWPLGTPAAMSEILVFRVRFGKSAEFASLIKKFHEAIEKTNWPVHYEWHRLVNGGPGPEYVLVLPHENWASLKGPEKSFPAMLAEAVGQEEAEALLERWGKVIKSESNSLARNRPDLSYTPGQ